MPTDLQVLKVRMKQRGLVGSHPELAHWWGLIFLLADDDGGACSSCATGCSPGCYSACLSGCSGGNQGG
jgi:hypothetical protein